MATEPTRPRDGTPDRHPDVPDAGPVDDVELPDDDVAPGAADRAEDDEVDEVATEHAMNDELPDESTSPDIDADYAALAPADEAGGVTEGDPDAPPGTSQVGTGPGRGDPPSGTEQPVTADQVEVDDALGSEDPADRLAAIDGIDDIDGIDETAAADELDDVPDDMAPDDEVEELSADVRAVEGGRTPQAFDDSSSVVESDMTDTGVEESAADGGDDHAVDEAVRDLPDDADGIESPER